VGLVGDLHCDRAFHEAILYALALWSCRSAASAKTGTSFVCLRDLNSPIALHT